MSCDYDIFSFVSLYNKNSMTWFFWQDDPEAHEKFVRINRAYEVLKDEDLRKVYDLHGEKGLDGGRWGHPCCITSIYEKWKKGNKKLKNVEWAGRDEIKQCLNESMAAVIGWWSEDFSKCLFPTTS